MPWPKCCILNIFDSYPLKVWRDLLTDPKENNSTSNHECVCLKLSGSRQAWPNRNCMQKLDKNLTTKPNYVQKFAIVLFLFLLCLYTIKMLRSNNKCICLNRLIDILMNLTYQSPMKVESRLFNKMKCWMNNGS